jgi:hypothetical protein
LVEGVNDAPAEAIIVAVEPHVVGVCLVRHTTLDKAEALEVGAAAYGQPNDGDLIAGL